MPETFFNYINGKWVPSGTGKLFENRDPAQWGEVVGSFQDSDCKDINDAVDAAKNAFQSWKETPAPKRAEILLRAGELLSREKDSLAKDITRETGKAVKEALGEVQEVANKALYMAGEGRRLFGLTTPSEFTDKLCLTMRTPLGVVAAITPWNFPMAIPAWKIFPAIVAGNTVALKPAPDAPLSAVRLMEILERAGLPPGVVNCVTGQSPKLGAALTAHPQVAMVAFTGSTGTGKKIAQACANDLRRVALELGGKNAVIIDREADLDLALDGVPRGAFGTTGQRCTSTSRLICHKKVAGEFTDMLVEKARSLKCGNGLDPATDLGPLINEVQLERVKAYADTGKKDGARLLLGGERLTGHGLDQGWFFPPTIFSGVEPNMKIAREEIFGPVLAVMVADTLKECVALANESYYGLSASIYSKDINRAFKAAQGLDTGIVNINSPTSGAETHLPFGGVKETGNGYRDGGPYAIDAFTEWKTLYVDYGHFQKLISATNER